MTFRLVIFTALVALARAGYINGGHAVAPAIGGSYISNPGLLRTGSSSYPVPYGYPVGPGRSYSGGISGTLVARPGYGSPYPYGGRNLPVGVPSYPSISGYGTRTLPYQSSSYSYSPSPVLKNGGYPGGFNGGFNGGYSNGYSGNLQNYAHQPIAFSASPIPHSAHASFNGLGTGYGY